jgi:hypothetical protein
MPPWTRFSRILLGSGGKEDAPTEPVKIGAAEHLPLDEFEPVDLALGLAAAPRRGEAAWMVA